MSYHPEELDMRIFKRLETETHLYYAYAFVNIQKCLYMINKLLDQLLFNLIELAKSLLNIMLELKQLPKKVPGVHMQLS